MINEKISLRTWIEAAADQGVPLHTYLLKLSSEELELSEDAILEQMQTMLQVMEESAAFGLTGVSSHSGLTGGAAKKLQEARRSENYKNILGGVVNDAVAYAMAVGECNAAMGRIVAAPTAGASGVLPGVLLAFCVSSFPCSYFGITLRKQHRFTKHAVLHHFPFVGNQCGMNFSLQ